MLVLGLPLSGHAEAGQVDGHAHAHAAQRTTQRLGCACARACTCACTIIMAAKVKGRARGSGLVMHTLPRRAPVAVTVPIVRRDRHWGRRPWGYGLVHLLHVRRGSDGVRVAAAEDRNRRHGKR